MQGNLVDKNGVCESVRVNSMLAVLWPEIREEKRIANNQPGKHLHGILQILVDK